MPELYRAAAARADCHFPPLLTKYHPPELCHLAVLARRALGPNAEKSQGARNALAWLEGNLSGAVWVLGTVLLCIRDAKHQARWRSHVSGKSTYKARRPTSFTKPKVQQRELALSFATVGGAWGLENACSGTIQLEPSII